MLFPPVLPTLMFRKRQPSPRRRRRSNASPLRLEVLEDRNLLTAGLLDPTFGDAGLVTPESPLGVAEDVAIAADGKIVAVGGASAFGDFAVARYHPDGTPDTTFDQDGLVITDFGTSNEFPSAVAIDHLDRIIVAGTLREFEFGKDFVLARYKSDGSLDESFGDGGIVVSPLPRTNSVRDVAIASDGKIVVVGSVRGLFTFTNFEFMMARFNEDGSLDDGGPSDLTPGDEFGNGGFVIRDLSSLGVDEYTSVAIDSVGRIVVAAHSDVTGRFLAHRYTPNGEFERLAQLVIPLSQRQNERAVLTIDAEDRTILAGEANEDFAVARLTADFDADPSFNGVSWTVTDFGSFERANDVTIDAMGRIVVAGLTTLNGGEMAVARYNSDGTLDEQFHQDGRAMTNVRFAEANAVAIGADGNIVVAGFAPNLDRSFVSWALAKFLSEPVPVVETVDIGSDLKSFVIQFNDNDLDPTAATNRFNYRVLAASGDADGDGNPFNEGDEFSIEVQSAVYDSLNDRVTIELEVPVFADYFRLEVEGDGVVPPGAPAAPGIVDLDGRFLLGGADFATDFDLQPHTLLTNLLTKVEDLGLSQSTDNSLTARLEATLVILDVDVPEDAGIQALLEAFILGVNRAFENGDITLQIRDELIADAKLILLGLSFSDTSM